MMTIGSSVIDLSKRSERGKINKTHAANNLWPSGICMYFQCFQIQVANIKVMFLHNPYKIETVQQRNVNIELPTLMYKEIQASNMQSQAMNETKLFPVHIKNGANVNY